MTCYKCPYSTVVSDENDDKYTICVFSHSENFLHDCDLGCGCDLDEKIKKRVYEDDNHHGCCFECAQDGDESVCARCKFYDGEDDLWKWEGDEN